jgi:glutamyl-queuosine tRNA(Asp) synthetase
MSTRTPTTLAASDSVSYVGRYAPSPTGALHVGNAFAAVVADWRARQQGGKCKLRIEDLDQPRVVAGAAQQAIDDLTWLGLHFDGEPLVQSEHRGRYHDALSSLRRQGLVYACACSRKELASAPHVGEEGPAYPGTCRKRSLPFDDPQLPVSWRWRVPDVEVTIEDVWQGRYRQSMADVGDTVLLRKDGIIAYQLAVVVDDAFQGVTEVVRAVDLLSSAPRQQLLHQALGHTPPRFAHLPILVDGDGHRISKRNADHRFVLQNRSCAQLRESFAHMIAQGLHHTELPWVG